MAICRGFRRWEGAVTTDARTLTRTASRPLPAKGEGKKARKGAKFRGNKATIWFRMSKLTQNSQKNKANRNAFLPAAVGTLPLRRENKAKRD